MLVFQTEADIIDMRGWGLFLAGLVVLAGLGPANAEPRIALVIGNAAYDERLGPLANPVHDAVAMGAALKAVGFDVELITNVDQKTMKRAISRLGQRLASAGADSTGAFFYAGHGLQTQGITYLAPIDAVIQTEADIDLDSVAADTVLRQMHNAGAKTSIIILDACRNVPVLRANRSTLGGIAELKVPVGGGGTFIAYSTRPGMTATDGAGKNSPYVTALLKEISVPNQTIEETFRNVRTAVFQATNENQEPFDSSTLRGAPFSFVVKVAVTVSPAPNPAVAQVNSPVPGVNARDFASVPTTTAPDMVVAAQPYLRDGPILMKVRDISPPGSEVVFYNNRALYEGRAVAPTVSQNMLTQRGTGNVPASFTITLPKPAAIVRFMLPRLFPDTQSGVTFPGWSATALNAAGEELDSRKRGVARRMEADIPNEVVSLEAPAFDGIVAVRFDSDPRLNGVPFAAFSAILIEGIWVVPMPDGLR